MTWRGPTEPGEFPTLGYLCADWIERYVPVPDGEFQGQPFRLSDDQLKFVLWFYRLREDAVTDRTKPSRAFVYDRGGQLVMPQKWGKGPLSAAIALFEAAGPALFDGWDADGEPVGRPWRTPWIQITAVSEGQTENVWRALIPMVELGDLKAEIPDTGETRINLEGGGRITPVTSAAKSRLGQRITFTVQDETHSWTKTNGGIKLADTQRRNLAGMGGRFMETSNAWDPSEHSVAQLTWEHEQGVYKMMRVAGRGSIQNPKDRKRLLKQIYIDAWWVDPDRIDSEVVSLLSKGETAQAERYFLNRVRPGEDRAFSVHRWDELEDKKYQAEANPRNQIVIGVDGARSVDAIAVIATELATGFQWPLGIWEAPPDAPGDYEHPLDEVDGTLLDAFKQYKVERVYVDPGSQTHNIVPLVEKWQGRWGSKKVVEWLMTRPRPTAFMIRNFVSGIQSGDLSHNGDPQFREHVHNSRRRPVNVYDEDNEKMWTIYKDAPNSPLKIDAAAAAAMSWEARSDAIADGVLQPRKSKFEKEGAAVRAVS